MKYKDIPETWKRIMIEARGAAQWRGHQMGRWEVKGFGHKSYIECKVCGACIVFLPRPFPNETQISGEAVALNCKAVPS